MIWYFCVQFQCYFFSEFDLLHRNPAHHEKATKKSINDLFHTKCNPGYQIIILTCENGQRSLKQTFINKQVSLAWYLGHVKC